MGRIKQKLDLSAKKKYFIIFVILSVITIISVLVLAYFFPGKPIRPWGTYGIELADAYCSSGVVNIKIRNIGSTDIGASSIQIFRSSPAQNATTPTSCCNSPITPGSTQWYIDPTCGTKKSCVYRITPPAGNTVTGTAYCP